MSPKASCPGDHERIIAFLDGELPPAEARAVEEHLATCPVCTRLVEEHRRLDVLLGELPAAPPLSVTLRVAARHRQLVVRDRVTRWASWAAAICIVASGAWFGYQVSRDEAPAPELAENWGVFQEIASLQQVGGGDVAAEPELVHAIFELAQETPLEDY